MAPNRGYRRGYPVAVLVGLEDDRVFVWKVFSNVVKPERTVWLGGARENLRDLYNFHESIINVLKLTFKEGVKSIILAYPPRSSYGQAFIRHVREHHAWLVQGPNKATFSETVGSAGTLSEVAALVRTPQFHRLVSETNSEETQHLVDMLEKRLNTSSGSTTVLYSLKETEELICTSWKPGKPKPEYLILTDEYLSNSHGKNRIHKLMQVAGNKGVQTRVVSAESTAGKRLTQLGGLVCFTRQVNSH